jgi:hypothetical protein
MLAVVDYQRPPKLYQYSKREILERSLTTGEFALVPAAPSAAMLRPAASEQILPFKSANRQQSAGSSYLTLSLADAWDANLFETNAQADCCLIIHDPEEFGERVHRAVRRILPSWAGIDAAISYGAPSPLGAAFSKPRQYADRREWLFAWRPMQPSAVLHTVLLNIGSIERIAELRAKGSRSDE